MRAFPCSVCSSVSVKNELRGFEVPSGILRVVFDICFCIVSEQLSDMSNCFLFLLDVEAGRRDARLERGDRRCGPLDAEDAVAAR